MEAAPWRVGDRPEREDERDQRQRECCDPGDRHAMERALIMLVLALRGCGRTVRMANADFESGRSGTGRELRNNRSRQHRMEHERIGGDPADELAPKSLPGSPRRDHCTPTGCTLAFWRGGQDTVQKIIA
jgi:hypothetical protein